MLNQLGKKPFLNKKGNLLQDRSTSRCLWILLALVALPGFVGCGTTHTNSAPEFSDVTLARSVAENTAADTNIGNAIPAATDADADDTLTYTMEGTDASSFTFDTSSRQIKTKSGVTYDHESKSSYSVTIKVSDGEASDTVGVTINITDVAEVPAKPATPTVSGASTTSLSVIWSAPTNTGKPAVTSYDLTYRAGSSGSWSNGPQNVTATSATISNLNSGTSYQVRVRATNDEGNGPWSAVASGTTAEPPPPPQDETVQIPPELIPQLNPPCHTQDDLFDFLEEVVTPSAFDKEFGGGFVCTGRIRRWREAPTIRIAADATDWQRELLETVVERINLALPWELEIGEDAPPRRARAPHGEIWVDFAPIEEWEGFPLQAFIDVGAAGAADFSIGHNFYSYEITWAHVWAIPPPEYEDISTLDSLTRINDFIHSHPARTVAHEILHALGFICHTDPKWSDQSIISISSRGNPFLGQIPNPTSRPQELGGDSFCDSDLCYFFKPRKIPGDLDLDALKAIYLHDPGDYPSFGSLPEELCDF